LEIFWNGIAIFGLASMGSRISDEGRKAASLQCTSRRERERAMMVSQTQMIQPKPGIAKKGNLLKRI